ncbi:MAG: phosphodiester glycosidase family protein [Alistipes sp.]|nr:phosphodiester glycosidase family protein [Alistipes sp.]
MKKCLKLSVLPLLLSAVLFCSCKDDEKAGDPNPIVKATVPGAEVTIDQVNKRIDVLYSEYNTLSSVPVTFEFVDGAYLYTPLMKNPATLDLSRTAGSTIVVQTGKDLIYYDVYGAVDYPLMNLVATADNGEVVGRVVINHDTNVIGIEFNNVVDVTKIQCDFTVSPKGGAMVTPSSTSAIMDLTSDQEIVAKSDRGGTVTYTLKRAESADVSIAPKGWTRVQGEFTHPSYMAVYKTEDLFENEAYVVVADKRAKFGVLSNGYAFKTTMPEFYAQDNTAAVMINGSATDHLILAEGQVLNQGTEGKPTAFGVSKTNTVLIGKNWNVQWNSAKYEDTAAYYAMYARNLLIGRGVKQSGLDNTTQFACSAIGTTANGYYVFFVCESYESPGITIQQECDIMAEWQCYNAVDLEGGSGAGMLIGGKRTIYSSKKDASGMTDKDYYKPLGCVGVLR